MGIAAAIGGIIKGLDNLIHAEEKAAEKAEETAQKTGEAFDKIKSEMRELDSLIKEYNDLQLSNEWDNTPIETKRKLQEDINRLLGDEADRIDIINGKYRETTEELFKHRMNKLEEEELTAFDDKEAKKDSLWKEMQIKGLEAERHFIINVSEMNKKESELFAKYSDMFDSIEKDYTGSGQYRLGEYDDTITAYDWAGSRFSSVDDFLSKYDKAKELLLELREGMRYGEIEEDSVLYDRLNTFISTFETKVNEYRTSLDELSKTDAGLKLSDYITNNVGGYIDNLEEYSKVIKWVNDNFSGEDKDNALGFLNSYFSEYAEKVDTTTGNVNKITVSLSDLASASDSLSTLSTAFKELNDNGYITTDTLTKIKEATGFAEEEWLSYEQRLLGAKTGSDDFNWVICKEIYLGIQTDYKKVKFTFCKSLIVDIMTEKT